MANDVEWPRGVSKPAARALAANNVTRLADLADLNELDVAAWHGMGPKALDALKAEMQKQGLQFRGKNK